MNIEIKNIKIGKRFRKDLGDLDCLIKSINDQGLLQPIGITKNNELVFGYRRLQAYIKLNKKIIDAKVVDVTSIIEGENDENQVRKDFNYSEKYAIAQAVKEELGNRQGKRTDLKHTASGPYVKGETDEIASKKSGFKSRNEFKRVEKILKNGSEELKNLVDDELVDVTSAAKLSEKSSKEQKEVISILKSKEAKTITEAEKKIKQKKRVAEIEKIKKDIKSGKHKLPEGTYEVIVIDPPWQYSDKVDDGYNPEGRRAANPYPTLTIDKIKALKIPASNDCVLWLWTTHTHMQYCFDILKEWGFTHKVILTWVKHKMGLGTWLRSKSEFCIMAVKGKPKIHLTNQTTVLEGKSREHSRKPDEFYSMVDELCVGRKLDYFSREKRKEWDNYGSGNKF